MEKEIGYGVFEREQERLNGYDLFFGKIGGFLWIIFTSCTQLGKKNEGRETTVGSK